MPAVPFTQFQSEVLDLYRPPCRKRKTFLQVRQVLREFESVEGVLTTEDLNPGAIARWIAAFPNRSAVTITSLLRALSPACGYAVFRGWMEKSPFGFRKPAKWVSPSVRPVKRRRPGSRTLGEIGQVLALADEMALQGGWKQRRLRALVYCYAYLGLRAGEAVHLWTSDVDVDSRIVTVRSHPEDDWTPKTLASEAVLPIAAPLELVLREWLPDSGSPWLFPGVRRIGPWTSGATGYKPLDEVKALGEAVGVSNLCIASFRKTLGTYAKTWGLGPLELKALLRHSRVETQAWYDDKPIDAVRPAAEKVAYPRIAKAG